MNEATVALVDAGGCLPARGGVQVKQGVGRVIFGLFSWCFLSLNIGSRTKYGEQKLLHTMRVSLLQPALSVSLSRQPNRTLSYPGQW